MTHDWQRLDRIVNVQSRWLTLIGEHWLNDQGETLQYWRVERVDSMIIIPRQNGSLLLPPPTFRPGIAQATLDFPGGRFDPEQTKADNAYRILRRELGVSSSEVQSLLLLNQQGWPVNSSFSNQLLFGVVAEINPGASFPVDCLTYPVSASGIHMLLQDLLCLQCRATLLAYWHQTSAYSQDSGTIPS